MKLVGFKEYKGTIILKSGLHIGAGDTEMKIGGTDNTVIKHPHTLEPYIPGSSLKGKIRSLLEMRSGLMPKTKGKPLSIDILKGLNEKEKKECERILKVFGAGADRNQTNDLGPTRASFADCPLTKEWKEKISVEHLSLIEVKSENSINRIQGTAENPRFTERVPADSKFMFTITLKQLDENENFEDLLLDGLKLLQMDALGGSGSRGYGRVAFQFDDEKIQKKFDELKPL